MKKFIIIALLVLAVTAVYADEPWRAGVGARAGYEFPMFAFHSIYEPSPVVGAQLSYSTLGYIRIIAGVDWSVDYPEETAVSGVSNSIDPRLGIRLLAYPRTPFMPFIEGGGIYKIFSGPEIPIDPDGFPDTHDEYIEGGDYTAPGFYGGLGFDYLFEETIGMEICIRFQMFTHNGIMRPSLVGTGGVNLFLP